MSSPHSLDDFDSESYYLPSGLIGEEISENENTYENENISELSPPPGLHHSLNSNVQNHHSNWNGNPQINQHSNSYVQNNNWPWYSDTNTPQYNYSQYQQQPYNTNYNQQQSPPHCNYGSYNHQNNNNGNFFDNKANNYGYNNNLNQSIPQYYGHNSSVDYFNVNHVPVAPSIHNYSSTKLQSYNPFTVEGSDDYNGFSTVFSITDKVSPQRDLSPIPLRKSDTKIHNQKELTGKTQNSYSNSKNTNYKQKNRKKPVNNKEKQLERRRKQGKWIVKESNTTDPLVSDQSVHIESSNKDISPNRDGNKVSKELQENTGETLPKPIPPSSKRNSKRKNTKDRMNKQKVIKAKKDSIPPKEKENMDNSIITNDNSVIQENKHENIAKEYIDISRDNDSDNEKSDSDTTDSDIDKNIELTNDSDLSVDEINDNQHTESNNICSISPKLDHELTDECDDILKNKDKELDLHKDIIVDELQDTIDPTSKDNDTIDTKETNTLSPIHKSNEIVKEETNITKSKKKESKITKLFQTYLLNPFIFCYSSIYFLILILVRFVYQLHHSALNVFTTTNVAFTVAYIYAFPYIVSSFADSTSAPNVIWYTFLFWFFVSKGNLTGSKSPQSLNFRLLFALLFVFDGVCNPRFIVLWNGGERLVLAFVLLSMKSNGFFHWSCFISLALLIITSVILGTNIIVQWAILVIALSSLSSSFSLDPIIKKKKSNQFNEKNHKDEKKEETGRYNPSFEANLLPTATTVGFFQNEKKKISTNKRFNNRKGKKTR